MLLENRLTFNVINHMQPSAQKSLDKTEDLVDVNYNHLHLLADCKQNLPEKAKPCNGPLVKIIILLSACKATCSSLTE